MRKGDEKFAEQCGVRRVCLTSPVLVDREVCKAASGYSWYRNPPRRMCILRLATCLSRCILLAYEGSLYNADQKNGQQVKSRQQQALNKTKLRQLIEKQKDR